MYYILFTITSWLLLTYGVFCPFLISYPDTILNIIGYLVLFLNIPFTVYVYNKLISWKTKNVEKNI